MNPKGMGGDRTPHRLKLTGYASAREVDAIFASEMVDTAYIESINDDEIIVFCRRCEVASKPKRLRLVVFNRETMFGEPRNHWCHSHLLRDGRFRPSGWEI